MIDGNSPKRIIFKAKNLKWLLKCKVISSSITIVQDFEVNIIWMKWSMFSLNIITCHSFSKCSMEMVVVWLSVKVGFIA